MAGYRTLNQKSGPSLILTFLKFRYFAGIGVAASCEKALDYYRRAAASVASEVSFSGGTSVQRVRLQVGSNLLYFI